VKRARAPDRIRIFLKRAPVVSPKTIISRR
jgi:hypothetical protein